MECLIFDKELYRFIIGYCCAPADAVPFVFYIMSTYGQFNICIVMSYFRVALYCSLKFNILTHTLKYLHFQRNRFSNFQNSRNRKVPYTVKKDVKEL